MLGSEPQQALPPRKRASRIAGGAWTGIPGVHAGGRHGPRRAGRKAIASAAGDRAARRAGNPTPSAPPRTPLHLISPFQLHPIF